MNKKPNILFLMSDEHRYDISGFAGNHIVRTPFLDKLAQDAVIFENAYTPSPVCIPARQCMASGQLPKTCNVEIFGEDLEPNYLTFARVFSKYAYKTVAAGKLHHSGIDQMQGWTQRIAGDCDIFPRFIPVEKEESKKYKKPQGFKWTEEKEILRAGIGTSPYTRADKMTIMGAENYIYQHYIDSYYDRATKDIPLLLYVGLINPHYPYLADEKLFNYYLNRTQLYRNREPAEHDYLSKNPNMEGPLRAGIDISERDLSRAMAAYYANVETMDSNFERIYRSLEQAGQNLDDWIIIYTSDHGEMLGEHAIWEKQQFFEGSVKVPLMIRYPKRFKARRIKENVNLCDLFATLCDLSDIPIPDGLDSRSLVSLMEGKNDTWYNESVSQVWGNKVMIKQDDLKYQWYGDDASEVLFDLRINPTETINYMNDARYIEGINKFRKRCAELGFGPEANSNYINAGYPI